MNRVDASQNEPVLRVLVVDNDAAHAEAMTESLRRVGYECRIAKSGPEGMSAIEQDTFDIIVTDLMMSEVDGMEVLASARQLLPDTEVIMVTGHGTVSRAVEAMQRGAFSFLEKPITTDKLRAIVARAAEAVRRKRDNTELRQRLDERYGFEGIIYASDKMKSVIERLKRIAPTDATVLVTGPSGTGKELIAQAIHQNSPRKGKRLVPLNCAAVAEHLVESELFGHVKGAYTDAHHDRVGAFEYANGGTIFLDEVGDMPQATQSKLLRVLEERKVIRVGDNQPVAVNVRVVSATNQDLEQAIADGKFRRDLYYRLKVVTIDLPPLSDRREDIIPLVDHFRKQFCKQHHKSVRRFDPAVIRRFCEYDWPGNVRQLRNAVETMIVLDADGVLGDDDLPPELAELPASEPASESVAGAGLLGQPLEAYERLAIEQTLKLTGGNREETARILGIGARTLYRKLEKYELS